MNIYDFGAHIFKNKMLVENMVRIKIKLKMTLRFVPTEATHVRRTLLNVTMVFIQQHRTQVYSLSKNFYS